VGQNETVSTVAVRRALRSRNIVLVPINVSGDYDATWNTRFVDQARDILSQEAPANERLIGMMPKPSDGKNPGQAGKAVYDNVLKVLDAAAQLVGGSRGLKYVRPEGVPAAELSLVRAPLEYRGLDAQAVDRVLNTGSLMTEGFVRYSARDQNFRFW